MNETINFIWANDGIEYTKIAELAQIDPTKFDRLRETIINQFLEAHPDKHGNLKLLQERIETKIVQKNTSTNIRLAPLSKEPVDMPNTEYLVPDPTGARFMHHAIPRD